MFRALGHLLLLQSSLTCAAQGTAFLTTVGFYLMPRPENCASGRPIIAGTASGGLSRIMLQIGLAPHEAFICRLCMKKWRGSFHADCFLPTFTSWCEFLLLPFRSFVSYSCPFCRHSLLPFLCPSIRFSGPLFPFVPGDVLPAHPYLLSAQRSQ